MAIFMPGECTKLKFHTYNRAFRRLLYLKNVYPNDLGYKHSVIYNCDICKCYHFGKNKQARRNMKKEGGIKKWI